MIFYPNNKVDRPWGVIVAFEDGDILTFRENLDKLEAFKMAERLNAIVNERKEKGPDAGPAHLHNT